MKVFSVKFGGVASFGAAQESSPRKFSLQKLYFSPIRESFLPWKFPRYMAHIANTMEWTLEATDHPCLSWRAWPGRWGGGIQRLRFFPCQASGRPRHRIHGLYWTWYLHLHRKERGEGKRGEGREGMISLLETKGNSELFTVFLKVPSSQLPYQLSDTTVLGNLSGGEGGWRRERERGTKGEGNLLWAAAQRDCSNSSVLPSQGDQWS